MLCYKDRTFCNSDCTNSKCWCYFGAEQRANAAAWWSHDPDNAPVAFSDFSKNCPDYRAPYKAD